MSNKDSEQASSESAMLKGALLPTVIVGAGCIALFSVLKGLHGFYGAMVAQVVVVIFFLVHLLISKLSRNLDPMATMALAMFSYFAKFLALGLLLWLLDRFTSETLVDRRSFGVAAVALTETSAGFSVTSPNGITLFPG